MLMLLGIRIFGMGESSSYRLKILGVMCIDPIEILIEIISIIS